MNILFFSRSAMNSMYSFGNTVLNLFENKDSNVYSHFYIRKQVPNNELVTNYFNLSTIDIIKGCFKKERHFYTRKDFEELEKYVSRDSLIERKIITDCHNKKKHLLYYIDEMVWLSRIWINKDFYDFLDSNPPDVFFAFATNVHILWPLIRILKKRYDTKIILFVADNMHDSYKKDIWFIRYVNLSLLRKCIENSDLVYGISSTICDLYEEIYKVPVALLCKGCVFDRQIKTLNSIPLKIVYAGNLFYGREKVLVALTESLRRLREKNIYVTLEVYSASCSAFEIPKELNDNVVSKFMGQRTYEDIRVILNSADMVLHVESFEQNNIDEIKYSFSTKITDCLECGTAIVCIGPDCVSSVDFFKNVEGSVVINSLEKIESTMYDLLSDPNNLYECAVRIRESVKKKYSLERVREKVQKDISSIIT